MKSKGLHHGRSPCSKKPTVIFLKARNLRFSVAIQSKIAAFSRKAKTLGVSTKCIFAFDPPPFGIRLFFNHQFILDFSNRPICIVVDILNLCFGDIHWEDLFKDMLVALFKIFFVVKIKLSAIMI